MRGRRPTSSMGTHTQQYARSEYHTQLAKTSFEIFDLTAGVYHHDYLFMYNMRAISRFFLFGWLIDFTTAAGVTWVYFHNDEKVMRHAPYRVVTCYCTAEVTTPGTLLCTRCYPTIDHEMMPAVSYQGDMLKKRIRPVRGLSVLWRRNRTSSAFQVVYGQQ